MDPSPLFHTVSIHKYAVFSSDLFPIFWGTRQGCPLSTALFILALEPLAGAAIRANVDISGVPYAEAQYKAIFLQMTCS